MRQIGLRRTQHDMTTLTINLPDQLVKEAKDAGLLDAEALEAMLREQLRQIGEQVVHGARRHRRLPPGV